MTHVPHDPSCIAILDIGTNAVRLIVDQIKDGHSKRLLKDHGFCELGHLRTDGTLDPERLQTARSILTRYCQTIRRPDMNVTGVIAVATEGLRRAKDGVDFINDIRARLDLNIRLINGEEEARYGARGVLATRPGASGMIIDLGGGSLQMTRVQNSNIGETLSLPLGVHRLETVPGDRSAYIRDTLPATLEPSPTLYVIGGSLRSLAKLYLARSHAVTTDVNDTLLDPAKIRSMSAWLNADIPARTGEISDPDGPYNFHYDRAKFLPHAALLLSTLADKLGTEKIIVSSAGIRDGLLQDVIDGLITPDPVPHVIPPSSAKHPMHAPDA